MDRPGVQISPLALLHKMESLNITFGLCFATGENLAKKLFSAIFLSLVVFFLFGCTNSSGQPISPTKITAPTQIQKLCEADSECPGMDICEGGSCIEPQCYTPLQCQPGQDCVEGRCIST